MPSAPPTFRPARNPGPTAVEIRARHQSEHDAKRGSAASRGYGPEWRRYRAGFLVEHPLCALCADAGVLAAAALVDHIEPHRGDKDLFWSASNHQALCCSCHSRKTAREGGHVEQSLWHPQGLKPSTVPLTMVCGPTSAGKSTYVERRARASDLVIDLDSIGARLTGPGATVRSWSRRHIKAAAIERNRLLASLAEGPKCREAWFVVSEPDGEWRRWWQACLSPKAIIVLDVAADECIRRIRNDPLRSSRADIECAAVANWWRRYTP